MSLGGVEEHNEDSQASHISWGREKFSNSQVSQNFQFHSRLSSTTTLFSINYQKFFALAFFCFHQHIFIIGRTLPFFPTFFPPAGSQGWNAKKKAKLSLSKTKVDAMGKATGLRATLTHNLLRFSSVNSSRTPCVLFMNISWLCEVLLISPHLPPGGG